MTIDPGQEGIRPARYWHGGVPGLKPGELLLPAIVTGTSRKLTSILATDDPSHVRDDRVHLTTDRAAAKAFAAAWPNGALYRAEPLGDVEPDPDAPDVAIRCEGARVLVVYDACVRWSDRGTRWLKPLMGGR